MLSLKPRSQGERCFKRDQGAFSKKRRGCGHNVFYRQLEVDELPACASERGVFEHDALEGPVLSADTAPGAPSTLTTRSDLASSCRRPHAAPWESDSALNRYFGKWRDRWDADNACVIPGGPMRMPGRCHTLAPLAAEYATPFGL